MTRNLLPQALVAALAFLVNGTTRAPAEDMAGTPAITRSQIEADWLTQARLRFPGKSEDVPTAADAAGGCDGVIDGKWGFHTANESNPWWQIDLGGLTAIDRIVLYNRCDSGMAQRNSHIRVLVGDAPDQLAQVYQHDGTVFFGHTDGKPLSVPLKGKQARFVRLQLPTASYFHLDEVQVFETETGNNVALGKPATQSSTSQWSKTSNVPSQVALDWPTILTTTLQRGRELAGALREMQVGVTTLRDTLARVTKRVDSFDAKSSEQDWTAAYFEARWAIRQAMLRHPLLDFDSILFVKRVPTQFPHISDQYYGWWSRPGGGVFVLDGFKSSSPTTHCLTADFPTGNFARPDLDFDGKHVLVAFAHYYPEVGDIQDKVVKSNLPEDAFYQLYEIDLADGRSRRITHGRYDDFDGRYLSDGRILFLSTRKGAFLQCSPENTAKTLEADLPDSYVRCGGNNLRPVPVFTLHSMDPDGRNMKPLSAFETFEYTPSVAADGRILYCRWDYIDRFNGHFFSLWSSNQDGSNAQLVYGNYTKAPQATLEPREVPGSNKILFTGAAHHSITGGSLVLLDRTQGTEGDAPITRLTPEVPFPETEKNIGHYYANPFPLSEDLYLVSWSDRPLPPHSRVMTDDRNPSNAQGIYLLDRFGNLELLYRDPAISSMTPLPIRSRPRPPAQPAKSHYAAANVGRFLLQDVYSGLTGVEPGSIRRIRIVGVPPKVQPHMNTPSLGVSREETGKYVMGSVPVEKDGSAYFEIPSGVSVFFQALDGEGRAVQTMRSLTYVQPGEALSCVGCHENREQTPTAPVTPLALLREPAKLTLGCEGSWPLRFDQMVQPVLDRRCTSCHSPSGEAPTYDLTGPKAHGSLLAYGGNDLQNLVFEKDASIPGESPSLRSKLLQYLATDDLHRKVILDADERDRLYTWMDTYGHTQGAFSAEQEGELVEFKGRYGFLFEAAEE
ncbi:MAG: discoidin domain-containing protein [Planctomycetaceae bacterium]|nr:discoidin domain-containing protein [Planctomycetaceae bacterium]